MNESTEGPAVSPGCCEVTDVDIIVLPGPTLTPDQDRLHLGRQTLLPGDAELNSQAGVSGHTSTFTVPAKIENDIISHSHSVSSKLTD